LLLAANGRVAPPFWPPLVVEPAALAAPDAMVGGVFGPAPCTWVCLHVCVVARMMARSMLLQR
jgi:hypothetical protein